MYRRARRTHERALAGAVEAAAGAARGGGDLGTAAVGLFDACLAAIPYAPATAFLGREKARLAARESEPPRVALVADGIGAVHGVTRTLAELRERGVPGFDVEVIVTDPHVDRRLPAVAEVEMPFSADLRIGVPSLPAIVEALADGRYDVVHLCSPGPAGIAAGLTARAMRLPVVASHHTELAAYAAARTRDPRLELGMTMALAGFYGAADRVLSPSPASDARLARLGIAPERIGRWDRGVDRSRFTPDRRDDGRMPGEITVLYAGRLTREKGADLLADAYLAARRLEPRLHLALAGDAPMRRTSPSGPGDVASSVS